MEKKTYTQEELKSLSKFEQIARSLKIPNLGDVRRREWLNAILKVAECKHTGQSREVKLDNYQPTLIGAHLPLYKVVRGGNNG